MRRMEMSGSKPMGGYAIMYGGAVQSRRIQVAIFTHESGMVVAALLRPPSLRQPRLLEVSGLSARCGRWRTWVRPAPPPDPSYQLLWKVLGEWPSAWN